MRVRAGNLFGLSPIVYYRLEMIMTPHRWLIGLVGFATVLLLAFVSSPSQAAMPLQPVTAVMGLPLHQTGSPAMSQPQAMAAKVSEGLDGGSRVAQTYLPRQVMALADPTNYGDRYQTDINGRPVNNQFIVVLHETVGSAQSAINLFKTPHPRDQDQVSYHSLIGRDGTIYYIVPPEKRAFGAGNSVFNGPNGPETVATNPAFPPSVNNFAYHVSLETPSDGRGNQRTHSGYTQAQYDSLAWLLAQTTIPDDRITTHHAVDRSGTRFDPRSFRQDQLFARLSRYPSRATVAG